MHVRLHQPWNDRAAAGVDDARQARGAHVAHPGDLAAPDEHVALHDAVVVVAGDDRPAAQHRVHDTVSYQNGAQVLSSRPLVRLPMPTRILVVDDSPTIRKVVGAVLERNGFEAVGAADGAAALERLAEGARPARTASPTTPRASTWSWSTS